MKYDPLPNKDEVEFKPKFEERYRNLLGDDYGEWMDCSLSYINKSIRVNTLKISVDALKEKLAERWKLTSIPWCPEGFWIEDAEGDRYDIGNIPEHQLGYFYIQEAASMIPPLVMQPEAGDKVMDIAAAPGSKTTQMAAMMENKGVLVANDVSGERLKALGINLQKCGVANAIMTKMHGHQFAKKEDRYDKVLVDAPCSGTGTLRTSLKTIRMWSPNLVKKMAGIQKQLLDTGFQVLEEGGVLVYSTCTLEPEENEGLVSWLLEKYGNAKLESFKLYINRSEAITEWNGQNYHKDVKKCLRIYPQDNNTEGFFVSKIRKE